MAAKSRPNEIQITRLYDAPVEMVWDAWTDPDQVAKWWGPRGFSLTTHSKDLRVGGHWHYTMHGPDGVDYPNKTKYFEVIENSRLVYDHGGNDEQAPLFRVTVQFSEVRGKTKMEMTMTLPTPEAAKEIRKFIKQAGGNATWDRLAEYLAPEEAFYINRSFDAPIDVVFQMWTDSKCIASWLPPTGFKMKYLKTEIRPDGTCFYRMDGSDGMIMFGKIHYLEIEKPYRIVYTQIFCDENELVSRHPMAPTWPETMLTTVTLAEEGASTTRVTVKWEVHGRASDAELETFRKSKGGMSQGWTGSFDKLDESLARKAE